MKKSIGRTIATFRAQIGLTQELLANAINSSIPTIWRWENDESEPRASDIKKLCEVLGCSEAELLNGPRKKEFIVKLKFAKTKEEVEETMIRDEYALTVTEDGYVGASGLAMLNSERDIEDVLEKIRFNLEQGFETKRRMAAAARKGDA
jgi:transcriptional regulator with XRE-family HTH domain